MSEKYKISTIDGRDYVSINDAKKLLGLSSAKELRSLGSATISIGKAKPLWSLSWLIEQARSRSILPEMQPDLEWIESYEQKISDSEANKNTKAVISNRSTSTRGSATSARLKELLRMMPPPEEIPCRNIDWGSVEEVIGIQYPQSFKDFIAAYGALQWFDWLQPLVPFENKSPKQFREFLSHVFDESFRSQVKDKNGDIIATPKFGTPGGFLPFMTGSDGETYAWITDGPPEDWNVICVLNRKATVLPAISIVEMLVSWLKGEPAMESIWGSVDEFRKHSASRLSMLS
ncbi:SMI1/KNR4 family protein [Zavarzinella formosa]|uniref:SMI1/KNR4 family protein n=1 Tax=Zavarzinella formosa TaxID=360055 RepID=UPI000372C117|nr:SMI1/KNR4 family protein [Zavarzinella formosa]